MQGNFWVVFLERTGSLGPKKTDQAYIMPPPPSYFVEFDILRKAVW